MSALFFPVIFTFALSVFLSITAIHLFPRWNLLDNPKKYGHNRAPIPYPGGIAPILALLVGIFLFGEWSGKIFGLMLSVTIIAGISFWDDRKNLSPKIRLPIHIGAAALAAASGVQIQFLSNPFGETFNLISLSPAIPFFITILWLVGFANVMNWLDGVPGLSAASAAAAGIFLALLSLSTLVSQPQVALLSSMFAASALGFFLFNISPPKMLLGDTGAMSFGFFVAALSVFSGGKMATAFLVLALPLLDAVAVVLGRLRDKKNPMKGADNRHLHDRLASLGFSPREILLFFLSISLLLGWASLQVNTLGKGVLLLVTAIFFFLFSTKIDSIKRKKSLPSHAPNH